MKNKGQTTVVFSLMISVLLLFTLTALEVGRIYMSRIKIKAVIHSAQTSIMADYNRELFDRYHLLFMDPTYGTGSEAAAEEKIEDYLEVSLNGGEEPGKIYEFTIEEIALTNEKNIVEDHMEQLKRQIMEYEKTAGMVERITELGSKLKEAQQDVQKAEDETNRNGEVLPDTSEENTSEQSSETGEDGADMPDVEVTDPRDTLKESLKLGLLALVLPENADISREEQDFTNSPSKEYSKMEDEERDSSFQNIDILKNILKDSVKDVNNQTLKDRAAFAGYVKSHFSNAVNQREDSVLKCEAEYILKGKNSDYDNLESVVTELTWLRMPVNYAYLVGDEAKQSEALTLSAAICTATGTLPMIEITKYLLLGCWAYGESVYEVKLLLAGEKIPYIKTSACWYTDLKSLKASETDSSQKTGMDYEDYLLLLLVKKGKEDAAYARMLDLIELNLQQADPDFCLCNLIGELTVQGKIHVNALFAKKGNTEVYDYFFEEGFSYTEN